MDGANGPLRWPEAFARAPADRDALLVLSGLASLTPRKLLELASERRTASECLSAVRAGQAASESDRARAMAARPPEIASQVKRAGARLVAVNDPSYPTSLLDLFDPPAALFVRGSIEDLPDRRLAIVGARNCSAAGVEMAEALAESLARAGVAVVSGGARGIDTSAHRGALRAGGPTVAVLGCGIDVAYPRSNRKVLDSITSTGAVVSEYPPGTPAEPFRFPARNRIIAALSSAVIVVEGAPGSGSMITADHALEIGRDVFAVPGGVDSELAAVPLSLIRQGAGLVRGPDDLLSDLGLLQDAHEDGSGSGEPRASGLEGHERAVWDALASNGSVDQIAAAAGGMPIARATSVLTSLELRGLVRRAGGRFERRLAGRN